MDNIKFTIKVNGKTQTIESIDNIYFDDAKFMFKLFDDKKFLYNQETIMEFDINYPDFYIRFNYNNKEECAVDIFMLACVFGKMDLVEKLLENNANNIEKLNKKYWVGSFECSTPIIQIYKYDTNLLINIHKKYNNINFKLKSSFNEYIHDEIEEFLSDKI